MSKREFAIGKNIKKPAEVQYFPRYSLKRVNLAFHIIVKIEAGTTPDPRIETIKKLRKLWVYHLRI
jgi:hypothetical protein